MQFQPTGFEIEDIVKIIQNRDSIVKFLLDVQNEWRISRAIQKDPDDRWLIGSESIDEIIKRLGTLEEFRLQYLEQKRKENEEKEQ